MLHQRLGSLPGRVLDGKAVEGVKIFLGGKIGENPDLAKEFEKGIPADESVLLPRLRALLIEEFGATPRGGSEQPQPAA